MWPILLLPECGNAPYDNSGNKTLTGLFKFPSKDKKPQEYQSWVEAIRSWRWSKVVETRLTHLAKIQLYVNTRSSLTEVFCKKGVLRNFTKFTGKHLYQSLFFNKVAGLRPQACNFIKKETLAQAFSYEYCEISKNTFSHRTPVVAASGIPF